MTNTLDSLSQQRILVTGASGFLGSHLCDRLSQLGAEVHALSRTPKQDSGSLRWWQSNLESLEEVQQLFRTLKPDLVFHLSGYATGAADLKQVLPTFHSQLVSKINLLMAATELGCQRLVFTASLEEPQSEAGEITPASPYAASKWAGGAYSRMFHKLYQTPVVLARPFMTYGPRQNANKIIPSVTLSLLRGEAPRLGSGLRLVDWIYVDDVIDGFLAIAHTPGIEGLTFDLGSGDLVSIRAVVEQLVAHVDPRIQPQFGALPDRPVETVRTADTAFAYAKLDWKPATSLTDGLAQTVAWYRDHAGY
ncbi:MULTISPECIES: NAD-dependent epimerase/dehydratase family protein [unclassified Leptolyngbya]|uniref:NAD-dependent epimerase/dehydratase family protein n=1 Tax=unclassified Leptolyngbya TaxID=2650499 RepID=UPI001682C190|nr:MULTISPECIES: NAD-dependent epimerase/dehydratase family protein [unclassified Leptolyngbya]MBD1909878.1 NAD-dependent epimerase/dehydratase family protein [Leptolyngbya sp. FACHB-8]MBD2156974.1 NAD-dependent epimerase/dehydratase family protein [Leptolyngbya sp. FACHB-16]